MAMDIGRRRAAVSLYGENVTSDPNNHGESPHQGAVQLTVD